MITVAQITLFDFCEVATDMSWVNRDVESGETVGLERNEVGLFLKGKDCSRGAEGARCEFQGIDGIPSIN